MIFSNIVFFASVSVTINIPTKKAMVSESMLLRIFHLFSQRINIGSAEIIGIDEIFSLKSNFIKNSEILRTIGKKNKYKDIFENLASSLSLIGSLEWERSENETPS